MCATACLIVSNHALIGGGVFFVRLSDTNKIVWAWKIVRSQCGDELCRRRMVFRFHQRDSDQRDCLSQQRAGGMKTSARIMWLTRWVIAALRRPITRSGAGALVNVTTNDPGFLAWNRVLPAWLRIARCQLRRLAGLDFHAGRGGFGRFGPGWTGSPGCRTWAATNASRAGRFSDSGEIIRWEKRKRKWRYDIEGTGAMRAGLGPPGSRAGGDVPDAGNGRETDRVFRRAQRVGGVMWISGACTRTETKPSFGWPAGEGLARFNLEGLTRKITTDTGATYVECISFPMAQIQTMRDIADWPWNGSG